MSRFIAIEDPVIEGQLTPLGLALLRILRWVWRTVRQWRGIMRGNPDGGAQAAWVTARLKPPPPVLSASAAKALPESDQELS